MSAQECFVMHGKVKAEDLLTMMLKKGQVLLKEGKEVTSVKGPYVREGEDQLWIINFQKLREESK